MDFKRDAVYFCYLKRCYPCSGDMTIENDAFLSKNY
jgi:hypothetical protein